MIIFLTGVLLGFLFCKLDPNVEYAEDKWLLFYNNLRTKTRDYIIIWKKQ